MALQGKLAIGQREYGIVECEYEFSQQVDDTGKPVTRPHGGTITFVMPSTDDDDLFTQKGRMYIGAYPSFIIAEVTCRLKREVLDKEKKDNYDLAAGLRCTVTTRDAMGQELRTDHVDCAHAFHGLTLTFDELLEMFGNSNKPYVLRIGIDVENGNSIHIFQDNEEEYGTIVKI